MFEKHRYLSSVVLSLSVFAAPAIAIPQSTATYQIAQELDPLCRQVQSGSNEGLAIRTDPSPFSRAIANVGPNERLQLAPNYQAIQGPEGHNWVPVTFPAEGYIDNGTDGQSNLIMCQPFVWGGQPQQPRPEPPRPEPRPPVTGTACRRVLVEEGLVVRSAPTENSTRIGGIAFNQEILVAAPIEQIFGSDGRNWVEMVAPIRGYVSSGYPEGGANLGSCF
ncbi:MAG: SH3 domain-containing protein [Cyanobacteria bacterium SID2]|nr:SH3 domain-containing protein [Cyanobacteria bacterium SID2]MBP0003487.1 SH3 domain-containing protein [Cyanobacteria bacterium SBC]